MYMAESGGAKMVINNNLNSPDEDMLLKCLSLQKVFPGIILQLLETGEEDRFQTEFRYESGVFEFAFVLEGSGRCSLTSIPIGSLELTKKTAFIHSFPNTSGVFEVNPGSKMLGIQVHADVLSSMLEEEHVKIPYSIEAIKSGDGHFLRSSEITAVQSTVMKQLFNCSLEGSARSLFIQSKVLELISFMIPLFYENNRSQGFISIDDEKRIRYAREVLKSRMTSPPNLNELSKIAELGIGKLKKGFKIVYGKSAYNCLHEDRMEKAHSLLQERRLNVSEVAWEIGYINVGHFSTAFRKQFGIRPKDFQLSCANKSSSEIA